MPYLMIELRILKKDFLRTKEGVAMENYGIYFKKQNYTWFSLWLAVGLEAKITLLINPFTS